MAAQTEEAMKRIVMMFVLAAALTSLASVALAGTPRIDRRQDRQDARIDRGVRSGQLTRVETARLRAGQARIQRMERRAKSDGVVTGRERARITHAQNHENRAIYRKKHNARSR